MGQFFGAYIENTKDSNDYHVFMTWGCLKLMEHSWLKNDMVAAVMDKLVDSPHKVAWLGDYSNENSTEINGMTVEDIEKRYIRVFPQDEKDNNKKRFTNISWNAEMTDEQKSKIGTFSHAYIVNHSEKCYVSLDEYAKAYTASSGEKVWITHPLPLLTACGNGQGGGDYYSDDDSLMYAIGIWAFDTLEVVLDKNKINPEYKDVSTENIFLEKV